MTAKAAKEYLSQIFRITRQIRRLKRRRSDIRDSMYSLGSPAGKMDVDRVQTSMSGDSMLRAVAKLDDMTRTIDEKIVELQAEKARIESQIEKLPDERYRAILHDRYVLCWKWEAIAKDLQYDIRYVYRIHGDALQAFAKLIDH